MATIKVILLESIKNLGKAGEIVDVRPGFFRNFLLKQLKARYASKLNVEALEKEHILIAERDQERQKNAELLAQKVEGFILELLRESSESGLLYGSVTANDIAKSLDLEGFSVPKKFIRLREPIKMVGEYTVHLDLHPSVACDIRVRVSRH